MARSEPLFTIITVNLNNAAELQKTIASVVGQTFESKEYLVVDGGSTDDSLNVVKAHAGLIDQLVSEPDNGVYDAMNKGVVLAHGEWILFLNSGDLLAADDVLQKVAEGTRSPDVDILLCNAQVEYADGTNRLQKAEAPEELVYGMICSHQAIFARRQSLVAAPFTVGKMRSDYEFLLRSWRQGVRFKTLDIVVAKVSSGGWSDRDRISSLRERWTLLRQQSVFSIALLPHFGLSFSLALLSPLAKSLLSSRMISAVRSLKIRYLGARSSRG